MLAPLRVSGVGDVALTVRPKKYAFGEMNGGLGRAGLHSGLTSDMSLVQRGLQPGIASIGR